jgi:hypothetical protein
MTARKIAAALALLGAAAAVAQTADAPPPPTTTPPAADTPSDAVNARRAVRDKATGKLRAPTPEEFEAMRAAQPQTAVRSGPLQVRQHAGGMRSAVLGPEYLVTLRGTRRADGSVRQSHVHANHEHPVIRDTRPTE